ncbi:DUF3768 domain-containing protein [Phaeobacter italicus]|uniref:DUF3768 domain-containing protein n=1 Tax=Phaeobacter italicus TaxID=481446 RepID=UPI000DA23D38|nr:DUF3768 domain-containing protein [Phaeobacter italicus]
MTITAQPQTDRPDPSVIAAQNDAFRRLACLGVPPAQPIQGRMHVTRSIMEAGDGFMAEAVKATGEFNTFEPENDPEGWHDFGSVEIRGETVFQPSRRISHDHKFQTCLRCHRRSDSSPRQCAQQLPGNL